MHGATIKISLPNFLSAEDHTDGRRQSVETY